MLHSSSCRRAVPDELSVFLQQARKGRAGADQGQSSTWRAWKSTLDTLFTCPRRVSTSHAFVSAAASAAVSVRPDRKHVVVLQLAAPLSAA